MRTEIDLAATAASLAGCARLTAAERDLVRGGPALPVDDVRASILAGKDPLGDAFVRIRSGESRRSLGAFYTPDHIVHAMVSWAAAEDEEPVRIVDPGCGSGRFLAAAAAAFPKAKLVGVEIDPLAALMTRATAAVLGFEDRLRIVLKDYREVKLPAVKGPTLYIGNPPYVRHHDIGERWKRWYSETAARFGFKASQLAGLHFHFFLRTREIARPGDFGAFITSAEWLDTNYGETLRAMLADGLGGTAVHVLSPEAQPFTDAMTTGAVTCFRVGHRPDQLIMRSVRSVGELAPLGSGEPVSWERARPSAKWSILLRSEVAASPGMIQLGDVFRVQRGQVTGSNEAWIENEAMKGLPARFLFPCITKAQDLLTAGETLKDPSRLRRVLDLPVKLDGLSATERKAVDKYLRSLKQLGVPDGYIASHRPAWWSVGLKAPAPILCTYMARRAPAFVRNAAGARHINIAHGLYPRFDLDEPTLMTLVRWLNANVSVDGGRTYAGGLTKFEPKELERLTIPSLDRLHDAAAEMDHRAIARGRADRDRGLPR